MYRYGLSHKISKSSAPKYYFNDTGILNLYSIRPRIGHLLENTVFLHLLRKQTHTEKPHIFYEVIDNQEVDFRVQEEYFEVKEFKKTLPSELSHYGILDQNINIVIGGNIKLNSLPYYHNLTYTSLTDFLKQ